MKKLLVMMLSLALLVSVMVLATSCSTPEDTCPPHKDDDGDRVCDVCDELLLELPKDVTVSFTVKDQDGVTVPGVEVTFVNKADATKSVVATGDAEGKLTATLTEGDYRVSYDYDVDAIGYYLTDTSSVTVDEAVREMTLYLINNNPNGTEARPYTLSVGDNEITLPANTSYYYIVYRAIDLIASIEGEGFRVSYKGAEYVPEGGSLEFDLLGTDTNSAEVLLIENTTGEEITLAADISSAPGSLGNPFEITELGNELTTPTVTKDDIVYYTYTAEANGTFVITLTSESSYVSMINTRNSVATSTSAVSGNVISLEVKADDEILIDCSVTDDAVTAVTFVAIFSSVE